MFDCDSSPTLPLHRTHTRATSKSSWISFLPTKRINQLHITIQYTKESTTIEKEGRIIHYTNSSIYLLHDVVSVTLITLESDVASRIFEFECLDPKQNNTNQPTTHSHTLTVIIKVTNIEIWRVFDRQVCGPVRWRMCVLLFEFAVGDFFNLITHG